MDIKQFRGLNNVSDPMRLDMTWLAQADNVNVTDTGGLAKREGYTLASAGAYGGMFSTFDFSRMYVSAGSAIRDFAGSVLYSLSSTAPLYWCEINNQVLFNNGTDSGIILADNSVLPWRWPVPTAPAIAAITGTLPAGTYQVRCSYLLPDGRETGAGDPAEITLTEDQALQTSSIPQSAGCKTNIYITPANSEVYQLYATTTATALTFNAPPDTLGRDLLNAFLDPLPISTDVIQAWQGKIFAAQYMPAEDQTVVWFSEPLGFHLFNLNQNFILVPGHVLMLAAHDEALIIGTQQRIYAYSGDKLAQIAEYGAVPGQHASRDGQDVFFWSVRGLCSALPFQNLTEKQISVAPGLRAGGCVVRTGGQRRYLACLQVGGQAFNPYP